MVVTMYLDPSPGSQTHVYMTPGMAINLKPLGSASMFFGKYFEHLLMPQRVWDTESMAGNGVGPESTEPLEVDPAHEHKEWQTGLVQNDDTGLEELFVDGQSGKPCLSGVVPGSIYARPFASSRSNSPASHIECRRRTESGPPRR